MKRGNNHHLLFIYLTSLIIAVALIFMGFKSFMSLKDNSCMAELAVFKSHLETAINSQSANTDSIKLDSFKVPCGIDKILFFDENKGILFPGFKEYPLVYESLNSMEGKNIFLLKNKRVYDSMTIKKTDMKVPYFLCINTLNNDMDLKLENHEGRTLVYNLDSESECTFDYITPIELSSDDMVNVLEKVFKIDEDILDKYIVDPVAANLTRRVEFDENGITINVSKEQGKFDYYEHIPKCAIESLKDAFNSGMITISGVENINDLNDIILDDDPLIMWDFNSDDAESISYTINDFIDFDCLKGKGGEEGLLGIGLSDDLFEGISDEAKLEILEKRQELGLESPTNLKEELLEGLEENIAEEQDDMILKLSLIKNDIFGSDLSDKLDIMILIDKAIESVKDSPLEAAVYINDSAEMILDQGRDPFEFFEDDFINQFENLTETSSDFVSAVVDVGCTDSSPLDLSEKESCNDGTEYWDISTLDGVKQVSCNAESTRCEYGDVEECTGSGEVSIDGACKVFAANICYETDEDEDVRIKGFCRGKDGKEFYDKCEGKSNHLEQYECKENGKCGNVKVDCPQGTECNNGKCVDKDLCSISKDGNEKTCTDINGENDFECSEKAFLGSTYVELTKYSCKNGFCAKIEREKLCDYCDGDLPKDCISLHGGH